MTLTKPNQPAIHNSRRKSFLSRTLSSLLNSSPYIALSSLIWLILRSGTKPTRIVYPCQQVAQNNLLIFGLPLVGIIIHRLRKCPRFRVKFILLSLLVIPGILAALFYSTSFIPGRQIAPTSITADIYGLTTDPAVVWVQHPNATTGNYHVNAGNQVVVDQMITAGLTALTQTSSPADAWDALLSCGNDCHNKKIAIKVNFNNNFVYDGWPMTCTQGGCPIIQTCLALAKQLVEHAGFQQPNIWFYDTSRDIDNYLITAINSQYPGILFNPFGKTGSGHPISGIDQATYGRELAEADYLINMPLLRNHGMSGVTLTFKNHVGSVACNNGGFTCQRGYHGTFYINSSSNPLVQLNQHSLITEKTVLILSDALFATLSGGPDGPPNHRSNSLFLSQDPVAIDSVMVDYLQSNNANIDHSGDSRTYLHLAGQIGLGNFATSCTQGNNCSFDYPNIDLVYCPDAVCPQSPSPTPNPTSTPQPPSPTSSPIPGDINGDGRVDIFDYNLLLQDFGLIGDSPADINSDGRVDIFDYNLLLQYFGS